MPAYAAFRLGAVKQSVQSPLHLLQSASAEVVSRQGFCPEACLPVSVLAKPARPKTHWKQPQKKTEKASKLDWKTVAFWHESSALRSECEASSKPAHQTTTANRQSAGSRGSPQQGPPLTKVRPSLGNENRLHSLRLCRPCYNWNLEHRAEHRGTER